MKLSNYQIGLNAEIITSNYLKNKGYSILKHRYKTRYGEIDIILNKQKTRSCEVAMYFLSQYHQFKNFQMRFDCFLIDKYGRFKYIENAWGVSESQLMGVL